jgi:hypothetical protein
MSGPLTGREEEPLTGEEALVRVGDVGRETCEMTLVKKNCKTNKELTYYIDEIVVRIVFLLRGRAPVSVYSTIL